LVLLSGCGSGIKKFPTAPVTGVVMCDGKPVPMAMVFFEPIAEGEEAMVGKPGFSRADAEGKFTLSTYGDGDGAVIGKHRVRVDTPPTGIPDGCNCQFSDSVDVMQVEIKDGVNEFTVDLPKAKKQRRKKKGMTDEELDEMEDA
ncbi:MAG: hypothetical protein AAGG44_07325, partial [Planctomycetota bacterium]